MKVYKILKDTPFHKAGDIITKVQYKFCYGKVRKSKHFNSFFEELTLNPSDVVSFKGSMLIEGENIAVKCETLRSYAHIPSVDYGYYSGIYTSFHMVTNPNLYPYNKKVGTFYGF